MKLKMSLLFAASVSSMIVLACSEVVFPTPLPTATPAPTATPIVFPTPLPTATPFAVVFPTPLPTVTPVPTATPMSVPSPVPTSKPSAIVFPTPLPTATPAPTATPLSVVFPTPLPTSTPVPLVFPTPLPAATPAPTATPIPLTISGSVRSVSNAFGNLPAATVMPLHGRWGFGVGFAFKTGSDLCDEDFVCLVAPRHVTDDANNIGNIYDGSSYPDTGEKVANGVAQSNLDLDLAVVRARNPEVTALSSLTRWEFAPPDSVEVGDALRVVTFDFYEEEGSNGKGEVVQMIADGIVSRITDPGVGFMLTASLLKGNSGGVVLNENMQVIGMVIDQLQFTYPFGPAPERIPFRTRALHVDAIRGKLCEWGYLVGSDCR